jgi:hypothetical protein
VAGSGAEGGLGIRLFTFRDSDLGLLDYAHFALIADQEDHDQGPGQADIEIPPIDHPSKLKLIYNATSAFNVTDLSPASMFAAFRSLVKEGPTSPAFRALTSPPGTATEPCGELCWRELLCPVFCIDKDELNLCLSSTGADGLSSKQRWRRFAPSLAPPPAATMVRAIDSGLK